MREAMGEQANGWRLGFFRGGRLADVSFAAVLLAVLWVVYAPSLQHTPRADQWCFLVDTIDQHSFVDILAHSYSYNRTRRVMPGDTDLYRPLLFADLAAEKAIFDADFAGYQAVGIFLHWGAVCLLLLFLRAILLFNSDNEGTDSPPSPSWASWLLPYGICLFFALNKSVQELVIWSHLHGYILFLIFLLASLTLLLRSIRSGVSGKSPLIWGSWFLALLSAFTYEMGQLYAVLAGLFLAVVLPRGTRPSRRLALCGLFASILLIYQGADRLDRQIHQAQFSPEGVRAHIKSLVFTKPTIAHSERFLAYTTVQPFFPSLWSGFLGGGRVIMQEMAFNFDHFTHDSPAATVPALSIAYEIDGQERCLRFPPAFITSLLTIGLSAGLGLFGLARLLFRRNKRSLLAFFLLFSLYGLYLAMTVLGRMNIRPGPGCLSNNSYYAYFGLLLALTASFVLWQAIGRSKLAAAAQTALLCGLLCLAAYGIADVRRLNESVAEQLKGCREPVAALRSFIEDHKGERDFSIGIDFAASDPVGVEYGFPIPMIIFKRWLHPEPKYIVTLRGGQVYAQRRE